MGSTGIDKVFNNAVSSSHAPGVTGAALQDEAILARDNYEITLSNCQSGISAGSQTAAKTLNIDLGDSDTLVWNLGSEVSPASSSLNGAFLFMDIEADSAGYYVVSNLRIRTGPNAIIVRDVSIVINGQQIDTATLFRGVNSDVPAWTSESSLEGALELGSIILNSTNVNPGTEIQLAFEALTAN